MTTHNPPAGSDRQHQKIQEQLPWYVNQTLSDAERLEVEHHLASCLDCEAELSQWQQVSTTVQNIEVEIPSPQPQQFAALMAQIDGVESSPQTASTWWHTLRERLAMTSLDWASWKTTPTVARLALTAQAMVIVLLAGLLMWRAQAPSTALYQTLSSGVTTTGTTHARIRLIFAPDTTVQTLNQLFITAQATVIAGPSQTGVYTIEVALIPGTLGEAAALTSVLETFRAHTAIELAEPATHP